MRTHAARRSATLPRREGEEIGDGRAGRPSHDRNGAAVFVLAMMALALLTAGAVRAQTAIPVHLTASVAPSPARVGEVVTATVHVAINPDWHVYSSTPSSASGGPSATEIVGLGSLAPVGPTTEDTAIHTHDPNFDMDVAYHERQASFRRQFRLTADGASVISFHYQTCNSKICLPPTTKSIPVSLSVESGPVRAEYSKATITSSGNSGGPPAIFILQAIGAGLLALITPCVFPLIPITLTSFVKQADGDRKRLARLAVGYSGGIVSLYVLVGAVVSATLGAAGANRLAANPWVNLCLFVLFVVFALSFFETITLQLPAAFSGLQSTARKKSGLAGLMLMGVAFVIASFTCTAPFVGTLLVSAAGGEKAGPLLGMFIFAVAFTSPFLLCAAFPEWISRIPRSGVWLARVKATLGFVELVAALKFLSNADQVWQWKILTQPVLLSLSALILFCAFLYLVDLLKFGIVAETETGPRKRISPARLAFASLFLGCTMYCFWGVAGRPISPYVGAFLPPPGYGMAVAAASDELPWLDNYQAALTEAKQEHKPLVVDFTGYTCTNCRLNEKNVFPRPEIQSKLAGFVRVRLYTDGSDGAQNQEIQLTKFGDIALPLYGIVDPLNESVVGKIAGVVSPSTFSSFLDQGKSIGTASWAPLDPSKIGQGTPTLVDFTAAWCVNCKAIERNVFENPRVKPILDQNFITMRADMTDWDGAPSQALRNKYNIDALPAVLVFDAGGNEIKAQRITGQLSVDAFLQKIDPLIHQAG